MMMMMMMMMMTIMMMTMILDDDDYDDDNDDDAQKHPPANTARSFAMIKYPQLDLNKLHTLRLPSHPDGQNVMKRN